MDCVDGKITEQRALQKGAINANVIDITQNLYLKPNKHFKLLAKMNLQRFRFALYKSTAKFHNHFTSTKQNFA